MEQLRHELYPFLRVHLTDAQIEGQAHGNRWPLTCTIRSLYPSSKYWKTLNNGYILEIIQMTSQVDDVGDIYERCQHDSDIMALSNIGAQLPCTHNVQMYEVEARLLLHRSISEEWTQLTSNLICLTLGTFLFLVTSRQYD